jgi:hypothetical protein
MFFGQFIRNSEIRSLVALYARSKGTDVFQEQNFTYTGFPEGKVTIGHSKKKIYVHVSSSERFLR